LCRLGSYFGKIDGRRGVGDSEKAYEKFMAWAGGEDFELVITDPSPEVA
jgi:thiamine monophosphate kinase